MDDNPIAEFRLVIEQLDSVIDALDARVAAGHADRDEQRQLERYRGQRAVFLGELEAMERQRAAERARREDG